MIARLVRLAGAMTLVGRCWCWVSPAVGPTPGCGRIWASGSASQSTRLPRSATTSRANGSRRPSQAPTVSTLQAIRLTALAHLVLGALDVGRWHLFPVPSSLRVAGLVGCALFGGLVFRSMVANRFFSAVVRIQNDRGHHVIDRGPYGLVRHPGYAGMILVDAVQRAGPRIVAGGCVGPGVCGADAETCDVRGCVPAAPISRATPNIAPACATGWCRASGKDVHEPAAAHRPAAIEDQLNGGGIEPVLFDENPRGQRLGRVVSADGHGRLAARWDRRRARS